MKRFIDLIKDCFPSVREVFPWDLEEQLRDDACPPILLDVREPYEFEAMKIAGSLNVPRGVLESAVEYSYEETVPKLVTARDKEIVVICRSGNRSLLAAKTMSIMGFKRVSSLKTGLRGWNDYEQPLTDSAGQPVDIDFAESYFTPKLRPEQMPPQS